MVKQKQYDSAQIQVLEGLGSGQKAAGYVYWWYWSRKAFIILVKEIADNSVDEAIAGFANELDIKLCVVMVVLQLVTMVRGIPVDTHAKTDKSALETVLTVLHAGGKFGGGGYKVSSGLHGVGLSVVNALSKSLKAEVYQRWQFVCSRIRKRCATSRQ